MSKGAELRDPDAVKAFISTLVSFNSDLQGRSANLKGGWSDLLAVWRDPQAERFARDWDEAYPAIEHYLSQSGDYVEYLRARLRDVEKYGE